jgi:chemotaxis protein CheZ
MKVACRHYMVKIVLIRKNGGPHCSHPAVRARFVALEFILSELRGVMVNSALPARACDPLLWRSTGHEPDFKPGRRRTAPGEGGAMPVQRKVFRIEQSVPADAGDAGSGHDAEASLRYHEFMTEIRALRSLIEPRAAVNRDTMEKSRAQIAEAHAYKAELTVIYDAIRRTRSEVEALGPGVFDAPEVGRAGRELEAIVTGTEQATQQVLQAAEDIDQSANTLSAALKSEHEQGLAQDIRDRVVQIYEACNFQDLTGQRVGKVVEILALLEHRVGRMMEIWRGIEQFKPVVFDDLPRGKNKFLNGPKLVGEAGHSSQNDIDSLFGIA